VYVYVWCADELAAKLLSKGSFSTEVLGGSDAWIVYFKTGGGSVAANPVTKMRVWCLVG
jgi:hypothetical protein